MVEYHKLKHCKCRSVIDAYFTSFAAARLYINPLLARLLSGLRLKTAQNVKNVALCMSHAVQLWIVAIADLGKCQASEQLGILAA